MTLYSQRSSNIRKTWALFCVACVIVIGVGWMLSYWYQNNAILYIAVIWSVGINLVAYWSSDKIALASYSAREADKTHYRELYRSVENLCITAGIPMPRVYIISDDSPNAFATGRNPKHASIALTTGLIHRLEKSELEGVIAHELSHIKNYDTLIMTVVVVLIGILSVISQVFSRVLIFGGGGKRDSSSNNSSPILMIVGLVAIIIAPIAGMMLQLAISRKREFVADANAALLTRYPEGLARALEKISSSQPFSKTKQATAHLFIINPMHLDAAPKRSVGFLVKLFMTHPPVEERIKALISEKK
jgi:heat shock protein HtpX